ncbi:MAG TPA: sulfotransferase domain-containing protein [Chitinophagaceae bacterium]|nr:sulfotransferase domain-containing protein [Chitinophagaceae bacterium]
MSNVYNLLESKARKYIPYFIAPLVKKVIAYPRYYAQIKKCRSQYNTYKDKYNQPVLFVAGLPKSGTTWFEKMLGSLPGFSDIMIPEAVSYEQTHHQSHTFEFPSDLFKRFKKALVVLKLHAHGSLHNFQVLEKSNIKYVVMYRDLRDVAVSHVFYVQRTTYHPGAAFTKI